jgi:uncharacterized coiled-coil DUF342 family protein
MAVIETQAFLTEAKSPTVQGLAGYSAASKQYIAFVGRMAQQAQRLLALLDEAQMVETDDAVRAHFEGIRQKLKAAIRESNELQQAMREMYEALREFKQEDASLRVTAAQAGYTV